LEQAYVNNWKDGWGNAPSGKSGSTLLFSRETLPSRLEAFVAMTRCEAAPRQ
jgi:hypothetical protein